MAQATQERTQTAAPKTKKKKWIRKRHAVITKLAAMILGPYVRWKYNIDIVKFAEQGDRQYLVVFNHQTAFDQFFVGLSFRGPLYYIASEDLFSKGFISRLLQFAVAPIPIKKQTTDVSAVINSVRVAREGGSIALAPEGNRTFGGRNCYINPAITKLARKLKLPIAVYRIEGGYGVQPRWSDGTRKGKMRGYVSRVIEPEEYLSLSEEGLYELLKKELWVDEAAADAQFHHKALAEYMERAVYVCPYCGLSTFESAGDLITCKKCGRQIRYLPTKELQGVGFDFPFRFVADWYDYQCGFINALDTRTLTQQPVYTDTVELSQVILYKKKQLLQKEVTAELYGDRIELKDLAAGVPLAAVLPFESITAVTVLGRNKVNLYLDGNVYQFKSGPRFNALRYVNIFYRAKNISEGNENGEFLGL